MCSISSLSVVHFLSISELSTLSVFYAQTVAEVEMQAANAQTDQDLAAALAEVLDTDWDLNER